MTWIRSVFESLTSADPEAFPTQMIAPAGTPIALRLDDPRLAAPYFGRFVGWGTGAPAFSTHFELTGQKPACFRLTLSTDAGANGCALRNLL